MRTAVSANRQTAYSELNRKLHRRIREISGHSTAAELVANLLDRGAHHRYRLAMVPGRSADSVVEHAAIVDAIVAGDGDRAERARCTPIWSRCKQRSVRGSNRRLMP